MSLKIKLIYENLLTEAQSEVCVRDFGFKLFDDGETNTEKEDYLSKVLKNIKNIDFNTNLKAKNAIMELRSCLNNYPNVLKKSGLLYKSIEIPLSKLVSLFISGKIANTGEYQLEYNSNVMVEEWFSRPTLIPDNNKIKSILSQFEEHKKSNKLDFEKYLINILKNSKDISIPLIISHSVNEKSYVLNHETLPSKDSFFSISDNEIPVHGRLSAEFLRFINTLSKVKNKLTEDVSSFIPKLRLGKPVQLSNQELEAIKNIKWNDIKIDDLGNDGHSIVHLGISFPFKTKAVDGIIVDIQMLKGGIYQVHISLADSLQKIGLGYKIYKALIHDLGHLYSAKRRRLNPVVDKIWDKLAQDSDIECRADNDFNLCMLKNNPNKEEILSTLHIK